MEKIESTLLDNTQNFKVVEKIKQLIQVDGVNQIFIATGFWDIPGTMLIAEELEDFLKQEGKSVKLLIGKDPTVFAYQLKELNRPELKRTSDVIKIRLSELNPQPEYVLAVQLLKQYCDGENPRFCIHTFDNPDDNSQFFHSKCWIFAKNELTGLYAIIGSSNFTQKGLEENSELNFLESSGYVINANSATTPESKGYMEWFNDKWNNSVDWTKEFLLALNNSPIGKAALYNPVNLPPVNDNYTILSPYETYIKFLQDQFAEIIDYDEKIQVNDYLPKPKANNFKQLTYQLEAVNQAFAIMERHKGFILADVVGLGKTYTALMIVKRHLLKTGFKHPVLIVTPPAVYQNWENSINYFDENEIESRKLAPHINLTTIGCLDTDLDNNILADTNKDNKTVAIDDFDDKFIDDDYGMIVVDESHRFRNDGTQMYQKLDDLIGNITARLDKQPYVALLSATPQNNEPYDLRNQIFLFQRNYRKSDSITNLGVHGNNLLEYFGEKQKNYKNYIRRDKPDPNNPKVYIPKTEKEIEEDHKKLREDSEDIRKRIIEQLVIRRTRTDIAKYYKKDMVTQNLNFPKIMPPQPLLYEMGEEQGRLFIDTIDIIASEVSYVDVDQNGNSTLGLRREPGIDALGYYRYRAIEFLNKEEHKHLYEANNLKVSGTAERLAKLTEMNLVKRLESSIAAFRESLHNLETYTQNMIEMFNADRIFICPDMDINKELSAENRIKNGSFEQCLNVIEKKAQKANQDHQTLHNAEFKKSDFTDDYIRKLNNDLKLIKELCSKWDKQTEDKKMQSFIWTAASTIFDKKRNEAQKLVIFTECIATQNELYKVLSSSPISHYGILSVDASNRSELKDIIAANFDANYSGDIIESERDNYKILITTDVLAEGVNLHRSNSILNYDSPWNATKLMQRLGRINRIGTNADKIWNYNFYPSTLGDNQINLKNRTYVKLQSFHELFGEDSQIFSSSEEVKHFDKVEYDEPENPLMPYISELREYKEKNPSDYLRLSKIQNLVITQTTNPIVKAFSALHELNTKKELIKSSLYITSIEDKKSCKVGQLEFFELLKPLSKFECTNQLPINYEQIKSSLFAKFKSDKQNASQTKRQKNQEGITNEEIAFDKISALAEIEDFDDYVYDMLDDICNAITNGNNTVIKQALKANLNDEGLGNIILTEEIKRIWKYTNYYNKDCIPELAITFIE